VGPCPQSPYQSAHDLPSAVFWADVSAMMCEKCLILLGAPRPMKMGTIVSPWRYDATFNFAQLLPGGVREPPILLR